MIKLIAGSCRGINGMVSFVASGIKHASDYVSVLLPRNRTLC